MKIGIKSWLGVLVLLAIFLVGILNGDDALFFYTLFFSHLLAPVFWVTNYYCAASPGKKFFFQGAVITGTAPWIASLWFLVFRNITIGQQAPVDPVELRWNCGLIWASSGSIAFCGGLLSYWISRCCVVATQNNEVQLPATSLEASLAWEEKPNR